MANAAPPTSVFPLDPDKDYRDRLAGRVLLLLAPGAVDSLDVRDEIWTLLNANKYAEKSSPPAPDAAIPSPIDVLSGTLKRHPDLQASLSLLTQYTTSKWLLEWELKSRNLLSINDRTTDVYERAKEVRAVGVCFSGGGIRSATFNLGILQGLARLGVLEKIDYLSTVSGGGYIHQFLASWIYREKLPRVARKLDPIPAPGGGRINAPEPIRWLRRYSNYLSPSVSIFGADMWTIATVWVRNTLLNLVILISVMTALLLLPSGALTDFALTPRSISSFFWRAVVFLLVAGCGLFAAVLLWYSFPRFRADAEADGIKPSIKVCKDVTRPWHIRTIVLSWLLVSACISPIVYQKAVPGGSQFSMEANKAYAPLEKEPVVTGQIVFPDTSGPGVKGQWVLCKDDREACQPKQDASRVRLQSKWTDYNPGFERPLFRTMRQDCGFHPFCYVKQVVSAVRAATGESPLQWLYMVFPVACICFCTAIWFGQKETTQWWNKLFALLCPVGGGLFSVALIYGIKCFFFAATFTVDQKLITALGITLVPSMVLAVPFISLELCTGLMGKLFGSAQREWIARLRAVSLQVGFFWIAIVGLALISPYFFRLLSHQLVLKYAVWSTWAISSVSGVLLGQSRSTNGKPAEGADPGAGFNPRDLVVKLAPPIFVVGLLVLLSTYAAWLIEGSVVAVNVVSTGHWLVLTLVMATIGVIFGFRIDINEFSMNAFYRDRLARCYAGASNPDRQPNRFTGFDVADGKLRVAQLLPTGWQSFEDGAQGVYDGPFPIFCTALNLTTGKELAYQERKSASFAITPLFSGYSTGWTDGMDCSMNYNGFALTTRHVKAKKGITVASAVAISGAAASPNMGFHSSTALAFLMTIFNVRLGWWLRNPRRKGPDSPRFGLLQLIRELLGSTNDTSPFVYLSDGGHFDNMGLYELLRRRCRTVIVCDAEADRSLCFEGIGMAIRKARVDFGIEIEVTHVVDAPPAKDSNVVARDSGKQNPPSPGPARTGDNPGPDPEHPTGVEGLLQFKHFPGNLFHALEGDIRYPEDGPGDLPGKLLYIKSTLTGDEPADIINYHRVHASFPFDTTLDQFFTESQFESYRRLGEHILGKDEVGAWVRRNLKVSPAPANRATSAFSTWFG